MILDNGVKTTEANAKDKRPYLSLVGARLAFTIYLSCCNIGFGCFHTAILKEFNFFVIYSPAWLLFLNNKNKKGVCQALKTHRRFIEIVHMTVALYRKSSEANFSSHKHHAASSSAH